MTTKDKLRYRRELNDEIATLELRVSELENILGKIISQVKASLDYIDYKRIKITKKLRK